MIRSISIPKDQMDAFCRKWLVAELSLGAVRQAAMEDGLGLYVRFDPRASWSLVDRIRMQGELRSLTGQPITILDRHSAELRHGHPVRGRVLYDA